MNWETMTELMDGWHPSWVQLGSQICAAILVLIALKWAYLYVKLRYYVWQLNRRRDAANRVMQDRGGRTWPL